jgi:hypothetical protein
MDKNNRYLMDLRIQYHLIKLFLCRNNWKLLYFWTITQNIWANWQRIIVLPKKMLLSSQKYGLGIRDPRSGIRDPGSEIQDPRPGSEIQDPKSGKTYLWSGSLNEKKHRILDPATLADRRYGAVLTSGIRCPGSGSPAPVQVLTVGERRQLCNQGRLEAHALHWNIANILFFQI